MLVLHVVHFPVRRNRFLPVPPITSECRLKQLRGRMLDRSGNQSSSPARVSRNFSIRVSTLSWEYSCAGTAPQTGPGQAGSSR